MLGERADADKHNLYVLWIKYQFADLRIASPVSVLRSSVPKGPDKFAFESFLKLDSPWFVNETQIGMDIIGFVAIKSYLHEPLDGRDYWPLTVTHSFSQPPGDIGIAGLISCITNFANAWQAIANAFRTVTSVTIQRVIRFGFDYFHQKSVVLHASGVPPDKFSLFCNSLVQVFELPQDPKLVLILELLQWSNNASWDTNEFTWAMGKTSTSKTFMLYKYADSATGLVNVFVVNIDTTFDLAPDLLVVTTHKSILGGIFVSDKMKITEVPHMLTIKDALMLQDFFRILAIGRMAETLGIPYKYPSIPT